jgi:hypothetical protein
MTNITVRKNPTYGAENRRWLRGAHGTDYTPTVTLDVSAFTAVDGSVPSGTAISKLASGLWGPFDAAAASGEHGLLFGTLPVDKGDIGGARVIHAVVEYASLPAGKPALSALKAALPHVIFA